MFANLRKVVFTLACGLIVCTPSHLHFIAAQTEAGAEDFKSLSSDLAQQLRFEEAAAALRKSFKQAHQKPQAPERERLRRLDRAAELKSRSDKGFPLSADEAVELTRLVSGFGAKGSAIPYAERAVERHPESAKALVVLAELIKPDQKPRALELLSRAIVFEPNDPAMYLARASYYFWIHNDPAAAEKDYRRAIELSNGSNAFAWAGLGDSLARLGRRDEALAAYRKYLSIRPKSAAHYDGEIEKSIEMLTRPWQP